MDFSEKLRKARLKKGMSQQDLATATGLTKRTIQHYENGKRFPKNKDIYDKLAKALGTDEETLFDDDASFVLDAYEQYGGRGRKQAEDIIRDFRVAAAGGQFDDNDLDFIKEAMMMTYHEAKEYNRRFRNHKYDTQVKSSGEQDHQEG